MANAVTGIGANNSISGQGTLTCPPGSYAFATQGQSGASVDSISGLSCRNIFTGATSQATGSGFGGGGGKPSTQPITCGNDGLTGFWVNSSKNVNLDGFGGVCRGAGCGGGSCGTSTYDVGLDGTSCCKTTAGNDHRVADGAHLVTSVTGAKSNNNVVANFGYNTLNFDVMAGFAGKYLQQGAECCAGTYNSPLGDSGAAECTSAKAGGLNCPSVLQNWCGQGDRLWSDGTTAVSNGSLDGTWARNTQLAWCQQGSNFNTDNCKTFCTASTGENSTQKEACNTLYANQCSQAANKTLDICSCSLNWSDYPADATAMIAKITGAPQEPMCYFAQCIKSGYKKETGDKISPPCPGCIQSQTISITNSTDADVKNV